MLSVVLTFLKKRVLLKSKSGVTYIYFDIFGLDIYKKKQQNKTKLYVQFLSNRKKEAPGFRVAVKSVARTDHYSFYYSYYLIKGAPFFSSSVFFFLFFFFIGGRNKRQSAAQYVNDTYIKGTSFPSFFTYVNTSYLNTILYIYIYPIEPHHPTTSPLSQLLLL